jgi:putative ABC transport system substrate-binding protein
MKNIFKKTISIILVSLMLLSSLAFASCEDKGNTVKVGIIQYMSHPSLDNCREGIVSVLESTGLTSGKKIVIEVQTGSASSAESDCSTYAKNMVAAGYDMIIAIATPAACSAFAAVEGTDIPLVFCAVSDPVQAKLVKTNEEPSYGATGTSDLLDFKHQIELIKEFQPNVKSIGVLYTTSEANSVSQLKSFTEIANSFNIEVVPQGIQSASEIPAAASALCAKVDCVNNFTDNNVVTNLSVLLEAARNAGIPVYGSEEEQVKNGCLASVSIDYVSLGKDTGDIAVRILNGESVNSIPVKSISEAAPIINGEVADSLNISIPEKYSNATTVGTNK